jgi:hypothetical protein
MAAIFASAIITAPADIINRHMTIIIVLSLEFYEVFVRSTFNGAVLHGKRKRKGNDGLALDDGKAINR